MAEAHPYRILGEPGDVRIACSGVSRMIRVYGFRYVVGRAVSRGASAAVTGGGSGIGRAIALHLARAGARVAVSDVDVAAAEAVAAEAGGDAFAVALDIADRHQFAAFLDTAEQRHGSLRVMVNNAGVDWVGPFHEEPDEVTRHEIDVNLYGTTLGSKLALKRMLPCHGGHLVNIASGVGRVPLPGSATYSATSTAWSV